MKSWFVMVSTGIIALVLSAAAWGQSASKEQKISGLFPAGKGRLVIENCYGKLDVKTWDRAEVSVAITVTARAQSAAAAQELLGRVSFTKPSDKAGGIYYKTILEPGRQAPAPSELRIDYVINMPRRHPAAFSNKYGDIEIADVDGKLAISLEYGKLATGTLRGADKDIKVSFGSATIPSIETGTITASYSRLEIQNAGSLRVSNQYEKTSIGTVRELDIDQRYGDLKVGSVNELSANVQFASMAVDKLLKSVQLKLRYGSGAAFGYVGPDVERVSVSSGYSNLSFHFDNAASLTADLTISYGRFSNGAANASLSREKQDMTGQTVSYKGRIGRGRGTMELSLSYGNLVFK